MAIESRPSPQKDLGSFQSCLVEGSADQRARERRIRRRALVISVAAQSAILTAIILFPLFGKPERIALANIMPIPPYYHSGDALHHATASRPNQPTVRNLCATCYSPKFPPHPSTSSNPPEEPPVGFEPGDGRPGPPTPWGIEIDDGRRQPERPSEPKPPTPHRLVMTRLESAMLIRRVEPVYPALARQIHREGQVELRAIIATDGTIQSLQVVNGDPLFVQSALDAVRQWRYRATVLDGHPVEIDTYITVTYVLVH